jgi:TonB-dependent SusC/RagA subfamily outer membrane receptor
MTNKSMATILGGAGLLALAACGRSQRPEITPAPDDVQVGYGTQSRDGVTGATTSLSGEKLDDARPLRIEELLRGRVAGLQVINLPGGNFAFRIRGTSSILQQQDALVIVDGVMIPEYTLRSALAGLIPEDIKRVDVLKDVASTSIYGMRGAGGVIVITTTRR